MRKTQQNIWGLMLIFVGICLFLRINGITNQLSEINNFEKIVLSSMFLKFCFYFISISLIFGGLKKILKNIKK